MGIWRIGEERRRREKEEGREGGRVEEGKVKYMYRIVPGKLPYDVSNDQALEHEEVRMRIGHTIQHLRTLSDRFQQSILDSLDKIP